MVLHVDEVNIKSSYYFASKRLLICSACNDLTKLANNMLNFLLSNIKHYYKSMNMHTIPTNSINGLFLRMKLEEILDKPKTTVSVVVPIILDGSAMSMNLSRKYLTEIIDSTVPLALKTQKTLFEINGCTYSTLCF